MNQTLIDLIEVERERQDSIPGNTNNHSDSVWIALIVKQMGQALEASQKYLNSNTRQSSMAYRFEHKKQVIQCTALMVAWLEDLVNHDPLA